MSNLLIDFSRCLGNIKPVHGLNNGPVCYGELMDVTKYYKDMNVPYIRLHDPNWPHPREVDYYTIFTNFSKDAADERNYDFRSTDEYLQTVLNTGAEVIYRLGVSIEHSSTKYHVYPPSDYEKFADICIGIIKHYNYGWANGFHHNIKYWEIWNEPDLVVGFGRGHLPSPTWIGSVEEYCRLYEVVSKKIKTFDPEIKLGGCAIANANSEFFKKFISYVGEKRLPMDFCSWHRYTNDIKNVDSLSRKVKKMLEDIGYSHVECHLNEWNYMPENYDFSKIYNPGNGHSAQCAFEKIKGQQGASFDAAMMIALEQMPVDVATFFEGSPTSHLSPFNAYGVPDKAYYPFKAKGMLSRLGNIAALSIPEQNKGIYLCAAVNDDKSHAGILISNYSADSSDISLEIRNLDFDTESTVCHIINEEKTFDALGLPMTGQTISLSMKPYSVAYIELR